MIRQDPILIASPPRCGTTVLAAILHDHGIWVGNARTTRYPGTNCDFGSENINIKDILKMEGTKHNYHNWNTPFPEGDLGTEVKDLIESFVPEDTPWLLKTSWILIFYKFFMNTYPDARWILLERKPKKILDSMNRHPGMARHPDIQKRRYIDNLIDRQSTISMMDDVKFLFLSIEGFVDQTTEVERLFKFLDMSIEPEILDKWLKPKMLKR